MTLPMFVVVQSAKSEGFINRMAKRLPCIFLSLNGGLGNQMFQYATGRVFALCSGAELVLDTWSGFIRDAQYRRHYALSSLPIAGRPAKPWERLAIWFYRVDNRLRRNIVASGRIQQRRWYGRFFNEGLCRSYLHELREGADGQSAWLIGYWQSPRYFQDHANILRKELMPSPAKQSCYEELGKQMQESESVALGVRLYEESAVPAIHAQDGRMKSAAQINTAISRLRTKKPTAQFYVYCTHHSTILDQLDLPKGTVYVTPETGYGDAVRTLWLLTQCRHHIFTNSSYYWWGAWLSEAVHGGVDNGQCIYAADNFKNVDGLCDEWERF